MNLNAPTFIDPEREDLSSASAWLRVHLCPGSDSLIASIPAEQRLKASTKVAKSGTRIHGALETGDDSDLDMTEVEIKERLINLGTQVTEQWMENVCPSGGLFTSAREERLWVFDDDLNKITSAKLDFLIFNKPNNYALIIDWKSGYKPTTAAERNLQGKVQAVALWQAYGCTQIRFAIAQHRFTSVVTQADYGLAELQRAYAEILYDRWRTKQPDAPRNPGSHCDYCEAKAWCKEAAVYALLPSRYVGSAESKVEIIAAVASLSPADLALIERRRGIAEKVFTAVKQRLKALEPDMLRTVGFSIAPGKPVQECKQPNELMDWLMGCGLIEESEILGLFEYTNGRMEELVIPRLVAKAKARNEKLSQDAAKKWLREQIGQRGFIDYCASRTDGSLKEENE